MKRGGGGVDPLRQTSGMKFSVVTFPSVLRLQNSETINFNYIPTGFDIIERLLFHLSINHTRQSTAD